MGGWMFGFWIYFDIIYIIQETNDEINSAYRFPLLLTVLR